MKTSQNEIVLTCYRNTVWNANAPIGHNIAFLRNTLGIDIDFFYIIYMEDLLTYKNLQKYATKYTHMYNLKYIEIAA